MHAGAIMSRWFDAMKGVLTDVKRTTNKAQADIEPVKRLALLLDRGRIRECGVDYT